MKLRMHFNRLLFIFLPITLGILPLVKGDFENAQCSFGSARNYKGTCKQLQSCPSALSNLRAGVHPTVCAYLEPDTRGTRLPLVCCETQDADRISLQKCLEFHETAARKEASKPSVRLPSNIPKNPAEAGLDTTTSEWDAVTGIPVAFVVGGTSASMGQFPFMVALGYPKENNNKENDVAWRCGGSLISDQHVLTAAHCVQKQKPVSILLGDVHLKPDANYPSPSRDIIPIADFIIHPDYSTRSFHNDIAIIVLSRKVMLSSSIKPACLPQPKDRIETNSSSVIAAGWGKTGYEENQSEILQFVKLERVKVQRCVRNYATGTPKFDIVASQLCAGAPEGEADPKDTCQGDSGGGLIVKQRTGKFFLPFVLGVTSFGPEVCGYERPGVYTNVQSFLDWIEDSIWPVNDR